MTSFSLSEAIRIITNRWPGAVSASRAEPVFLLAAGWRSGSTLLQRMLMRRCFIWGEPFGRAMLVDSLAAPLRVITSQWPVDGVIPQPAALKNADLSQKWIANLYPPIEALQAAQIAWFTVLFQTPAEEIGFSRWGLKEVRLSIEHAVFLKWLFPRAKFLFLLRDPFECYRSFLALKATYVRWPDQRIDTPENFAQHWLSLAPGFVKRHREVDGFLIRYEDLCSADFDPEALNRYLGFELEIAARDVKVGASRKEKIPAVENVRLRSSIGGLAAELGYREI